MAACFSRSFATALAGRALLGSLLVRIQEVVVFLSEKMTQFSVLSSMALVADAAVGVVVEASAAPGCLFWTGGDFNAVPKKYWSSMYWRPLKPKIHLTYTLVIHYLYQPISYPFLLDKSSLFPIWSPLKSPCFQTIVALPGVSIAAWRGMKPAHVHRYGHTESRKSHRFQRLDQAESQLLFTVHSNRFTWSQDITSIKVGGHRKQQATPQQRLVLVSCSAGSPQDARNIKKPKIWSFLVIVMVCHG